VLGTDSGERWVGSASFLAAEESMMQAFDAERPTRREETLQVHPSGDVAWFSTVFDLETSVGGELGTFEGLRTTGLIAKRDGRWLLLQCHTCVPVAGQQVEYR
jgi:ketosteroid isomerase-like protein